MKNRRTRVTVSLPSELVESIDRMSRELRETRSAIFEEWLRVGSRRSAEERERRQYESYYRMMSDRDRREQEAMSRAGSHAAEHLRFADDSGRTGRSRRRGK